VNSRGFTLIEVLVALLAASLLLIPLGWAVGRLGKDLKTEQVNGAVHSWADDAYALRHLVATGSFADANGQPLADGPGFVRMRISPPQSVVGAGMVLAELRSSGAAGDHGIRLSIVQPSTVEPSAGEPSAMAPPVDLFPGGRDVKLRLVRTPDNRQASAHVQIDLRDARGRKFAMRFAPSVSGNPACEFDLVSLACR